MVAVAQDNFPDVPASYYLDRFESELREVGWHLGPQALRNSKPTREESAKGIVKTIQALPGLIEKDALSLQRQIEQGKLEMDLRTLQRRATILEGGIVGMGVIRGLKQLVDAYQAEIAKQGVAKDELLKVVADCETPLKRLTALYREAIRLRSAETPRSQNKLEKGDRFLIDTPKHHGFAVLLARFHAEGWISLDELGMSALMHNIRPPRSLFAFSAIRLIPELRDRLEGTLALEKEWLGKRETLGDLTWLHRNRDFYSRGIRDGVLFWISEFEPEIKAAGGDPATLQRQLDTCTEPLRQLAAIYDVAIQKAGGARRFPDVPFKHWAESAVQELRDAGILKGYSDGLFRGGR